MKFRLVSRLYHLVFLLLLAGNLFAQVPARPQPQRLVNDLSGLFSSRQVQVLERALVDFADSTSNQIVVVTVPELYGYDKAELAYEIGQQWGVGQKEFDNGLVILIKPKTAYSNGEVFIATGYGLEGAVTDAFAKIDTRYKAEELKKLVHFIVFDRRGEDINGITPGWDYELAGMDYVDISSTEIRAGSSSVNNIMEGYIKKNGLYKI